MRSKRLIFAFIVVHRPEIYLKAALGFQDFFEKVKKKQMVLIKFYWRQI